MPVKPLPQSEVAQCMITGLIPHLSANQHKSARSWERNGHVGHLALNMIKKEWVVGALVDSQDKKRRERDFYPVTIVFGGDAHVKEEARRLIASSDEFRRYTMLMPNSTRDLVERLQGMYPLVPLGRTGWTDSIQPGCECDFHVHAAEQFPGRAAWCVHSAALMIKLAYQVEYNSGQLAGLHGFDLNDLSKYIPAEKVTTYINLMESDSEDEPIGDYYYRHKFKKMKNKGKAYAPVE